MVPVRSPCRPPRTARVCTSPCQARNPIRLSPMPSRLARAVLRPRRHRGSAADPAPTQGCPRLAEAVAHWTPVRQAQGARVAAVGPAMLPRVVAVSAAQVGQARGGLVPAEPGLAVCSAVEAQAWQIAVAALRVAVVRVPQAGVRAMLAAARFLQEGMVPVGCPWAGSVAVAQWEAWVTVVLPRAGPPPSRPVHLLAVPAQCRELDGPMPAECC
jgi:hypothetical protein